MSYGFYQHFELLSFDALLCQAVYSNSKWWLFYDGPALP